MSNSGPPELPRLIGASVWMKSSYGPSWMSRPRAEMMPAVTDPPRPNGLPIANTQSPIRDAVESPQLSAGSGLPAYTFSSAMSPASSRPTTLAWRVVLSCRVTLISSAPSITWLLVTISPEGSMMNPDPRLCSRRSSGGAAPPLVMAVHEILKELVEWRARGHPGNRWSRISRLDVGGGGHVDHGRQQLRREVGETVRRRPA